MRLTRAVWLWWLLAFSLLLVGLDLLLNLAGFHGVLASVVSGLMAFVFADSVGDAMKWGWQRRRPHDTAEADGQT